MGVEVVTPGISCASLPAGSDNYYEAIKTPTAPLIDGMVDDVWAMANVEAMNIPWLFDSLKSPTSDEDYLGCYKAMWIPGIADGSGNVTEPGKLFILAKIVDERLVYTPTTGDAIHGEFWNEDTIEIFFDPDNSGGGHQYNNWANAFAYHITPEGKTVDGVNGGPTLMPDHVEVTRVDIGHNNALWEIAITVWAAEGPLGNQSSVVWTTLHAGDVMGFTMSYIDNDFCGQDQACLNSPLASNNRGREHFMGSVDSMGHQMNQGYINADAFGELRLVE